MKTLIINSIIWLLLVAFLSTLVWGTLELTEWISNSGYQTYAGLMIIVFIVVGLYIKLYQEYQA